MSVTPGFRPLGELLDDDLASVDNARDLAAVAEALGSVVSPCFERERHHGASISDLGGDMPEHSPILEAHSFLHPEASQRDDGDAGAHTVSSWCSAS